MPDKGVIISEGVEVIGDEIVITTPRVTRISHATLKAEIVNLTGQKEQLEAGISTQQTALDTVLNELDDKTRLLADAEAAGLTPGEVAEL